MAEDLKARLEISEAALDWILDRLKSSIGGRPVRDMDEAISFAEEALKPFYVERVAAERDAALLASSRQAEKEGYLSVEETHRALGLDLPSKSEGKED